MVTLLYQNQMLTPFKVSNINIINILHCQAYLLDVYFSRPLISDILFEYNFSSRNSYTSMYDLVRQ